MNTHHIKYFVDAARSGGIVNAATQNYVTHSAVSQAIKTLETELGFNLLHHEKRKFILTAEGESALAKFEDLLRQLAELKKDISAKSEIPRGELRIMTAQSLMTTFISEALVRYKTLYPMVKIKLTSGPAAAVQSALIENGADLGFLVDNHRLHGCDSETIANGVFQLIKKPSSKRKLRDGVIVTSDTKVEVLHLLKAYRAKNRKLELPLEMEVMSWTLIKSIVLKSDAIGYVPDYVAESEVRAGKLEVLRQPSEAFTYDIKAAWSRGRAFQRNAELFFNLLQRKR